MKIIIKWLLISLAILALTIACNSSDEKIIEWQLLFNGESLDGWNVIGGKANYSIEDSILICSIDEGVDASFLSTNKTYDNFILEYEPP